jgi:hypothetical protein
MLKVLKKSVSRRIPGIAGCMMVKVIPFCRAVGYYTNLLLRYCIDA